VDYGKMSNLDLKLHDSCKLTSWITQLLTLGVVLARLNLGENIG